MTDKKTLAQRYLAAVNDELGWGGVEEPDGDIRFVSDLGASFWITNTAPADPEYLQLITMFRLSSTLANIGSPLDADRPEHRLPLLMAADRVVRRTKGAKMSVAPEQDRFAVAVEVVAAGKSRMPSVDHLAAILPRMLNMATSALAAFNDELVVAGLELSFPDVDGSLDDVSVLPDPPERDAL
jgi:hypothetical protein